MHRYRPNPRSVREEAALYGDLRDDRFPADEVLDDLASAPEAEGALRLARILARYAALRYWLLRTRQAPPAVLRHAERAARAHLAAVGPWEEGSLLLDLVDADLDRAGGLLARAAAEAGGQGDRAGATALRQAARLAALLRLRDQRRPPE